MTSLKTQKFKILDLFCKAGGASYGMFWIDPVNIEINGVDIEFQKNYPFKFIQADFRDVDLSNYDFIWASPPCQIHSRATKPEFKKNHIDLIPETRSFLNYYNKPFVIENVPSSTLNVNLKLYGEMFHLDFRKERWFETSFFILAPGNKRIKPLKIFSGNDRSRHVTNPLKWMNYKEFKNSVPPEYSYYILKSYLESQSYFSRASKVPANQSVFPCEGLSC